MASNSRSIAVAAASTRRSPTASPRAQTDAGVVSDTSARTSSAVTGPSSTTWRRASLSSSPEAMRLRNRRSTSPSVTRAPSRSASSRAAPVARPSPRSRASSVIQAARAVGRGAIASRIAPPAAFTASDSAAHARPLGVRLRRLDEGQRVARRHEPDRLDDAVAGLVAPGERARVGDHRQRPGPEHRRRRETLVQGGRVARRGRRVGAQVPALERRAELGLQCRREAPDESLCQQLVVAPDVEQRDDHLAGISHGHGPATVAGRRGQGRAAASDGAGIAIGRMVAEGGRRDVERRRR